MNKVPAHGVTTKGFDVSHYQPNTDFAAMKKAGHEFCFLKATEGVSYTDASFKSHWVKAKAAGLLVGAYHFFHPKQDPKKQAAHFAQVVGPLSASDLPCVIDWETTDKVPSSADEAAGKEFVEEVKRLTGKDPIIYGGPYFLQALSLAEGFKNYPLWVAHYSVNAPLVPAPWKVWSFWQVADNGFDHNVFNGSLEQLKKIAAG